MLKSRQGEVEGAEKKKGAKEGSFDHHPPLCFAVNTKEAKDQREADDAGSSHEKNGVVFEPGGEDDQAVSSKP